MAIATFVVALLGVQSQRRSAIITQLRGGNRPPTAWRRRRPPLPQHQQQFSHHLRRDGRRGRAHGRRHPAVVRQSRPPSRRSLPRNVLLQLPRSQRSRCPNAAAGPGTDSAVEERAGSAVVAVAAIGGGRRPRNGRAPASSTHRSRRSTVERLECEPARCGQCGAVLNPFAHVEPQSGRWCCSVCGGWSVLPPRLASATSMPDELKPEHATVEYDLPPDAPDAPRACMLFVVDCSLPAEELAHLQETLSQVLASLPPDTPVGLVTYAEEVELHELGHPLGPRLWRLPVEVAQGPPSNCKRSSASR